jgi:hypothetical protein
MEEGKISQYAAPLVFAAGISYVADVSVDKPNLEALEALEEVEQMKSDDIIMLTVEEWNTFQAALDNPAQDLPQLRKLLTKPGVLG